MPNYTADLLACCKAAAHRADGESGVARQALPWGSGDTAGFNFMGKTCPYLPSSMHSWTHSRRRSTDREQGRGACNPSIGNGMPFSEPNSSPARHQSCLPLGTSCIEVTVPFGSLLLNLETHGRRGILYKNFVYALLYHLSLHHAVSHNSDISA